MQAAPAPASATEVLGLAFTHTRTVLASSPFRPGRFLKLALVAALTQSTFFSVSISYPLQGGQLAFLSRAHRAGQQAFAGADAGALAALGLGVLVGILGLAVLVALVYLYLFCRARATLFDLVVFRGNRVREAWRRRARPARRYFGLLLLQLLLFWMVLAAVLGPVIVRFVKAAPGQAGGVGLTPAAGSLMLTLVGLVWLLLPVWIAVDALLEDFILPVLSLEPEATVGDAFARLGGMMRQSLGQLLLFLVLRTLIAFSVGCALGLVTLVCVGLLALGGYGAGLLLYHVFWSAGLVGHTVFFAAIAGMMLGVAMLYLLAVTAIFGITGTFKTSYAACFFAGYYPRLAAALAGQSVPQVMPMTRAEMTPGLW